MNQLVLAFAFLTGAAQGLQVQTSISNGFYEKSRKNEGALVPSPNGPACRLGAKRIVKVNKAELIASSNWNDSFRLFVWFEPFDEGMENDNEYLLVVNGKAYSQTTIATMSKKVVYIDFAVSGSKNVEEVAKFLAVAPKKRKHPGHQLLIAFVPKKKSYLKGSDNVDVTFRVKNVGSKTIEFQRYPKTKSAPRDNQFAFVGSIHEKPLADIGTTAPSWKTWVEQTIKPGETFEVEVNVARWFHFDKIGTYDLVGSYYFAQVEPGKFDGQTIWSEYVSSPFQIIVEDQGAPAKK